VKDSEQLRLGEDVSARLARGEIVATVQKKSRG
jgi:hypothetical protein